MKVGIDIGGSHIAIGFVNEEGKVIQKIEQDIQPVEGIGEYLVNYVDNALQKLSKTADISYIGMATPGNPKGSVVSNLVNLGIDEIDFHSIEEKYQVTIRSINDGKASALAEKRYGAMKEFRDAVFLCMGTGIGGAVFLDNKLLLAHRNAGFELGHIVIDKNGRECKCGKKGCFETYCSMKRFKENISEVFQKMNIQVSANESQKLVTLLEQYKNNDEVAYVINQYIHNLIIGLSNIIDIFEPEGIVLGGSFVYFKNIFYQKLIDTMEERKYVFNKEALPKIKLADLKNDAGLIGATLL